MTAEEPRTGLTAHVAGGDIVLTNRMLRLLPSEWDDDGADLQASMVRHPAGSRREPHPSPRRRWWLRIGRRS